ncbi:cytochrome C peroxidase [Chryseobacterium sp. SNU WT5]|uniref:cytochrome-c peroxidase n=1 Tax=Chryseobacterium sp. SNU WT5 TaxID=2594269 RepID=UPI00117DA1E7|nr:cytochrome c peroxidase [Chryseobacterium sp. SNU WT5]QDP86122.1 cytochrome C peroxidase [Chryseobacterium sp. SNU WT5]
MKFTNTFLTVLALAVFSFALVLKACYPKVEQPISEDLVSVKKEILQINKDFNNQTTSFLRLMETENNSETLQTHFLRLRITYKKMEWAVEYFLPNSARFINGPAIPEIEAAENMVIEPEGLQVLEELVYPYEPENKAEVIRQLKKLLSNSGTIETHFTTISIDKAQVFDAIRQEVFRITSLGISGFDTPVSASHLEEMPVTLESIGKILTMISKNKENIALEKITKKLTAAKIFLKKNPDPQTFNYAQFLPEYLNQISALLLDFKSAEKIKDIGVVRALKKDASSFFALGAFDVNAFVPGEKYQFSAEKASLGKKLFNDPQLSKSNDRSCASCHHSEKAFSDGKVKSLSLEGGELSRNTPSLSYSAFQHGQFWDMRREDLESQTADVITNKDEMHGNLKDIADKINKNTNYVKEFNVVFGGENVDVWQIQNALASYIRSLPQFNSDFDEFMRGNPKAISEKQKEGFNLFVGKAKCASCHFIPLFNGTVPPDFSKTEQEILGIAANFHNKELDNDKGKGKFSSQIAFLQNSFKTPTIRNIEKTAPYMHNGGYQTLEQVMEFYNKGGGKGFGFKVENQTLSENELKLTYKETASIIDFMRSLNDH